MLLSLDMCHRFYAGGMRDTRFASLFPLICAGLALKEMEASIMEMTIGESGAFDEENLAIAFTDELQFSVYGYRDESEPNSGTYYQDNSLIYIQYYGQSDGTFVSIGQISGNELALNLSMRTGMSITPASITLTFELSTN